MAELNEPKTGSEQQVTPAAAAPAQAPTPLRPTARPDAPAKEPVDDRDDFIRNALPVAAALRKSGKPEEAKQLEQVAQAIMQTKSMVRDQAPAQAPDKEQSIKDMLANVYKAIDQDPALKNMPEAKAMRSAGKKLDEDGMLNITVRNGVVVSFVSNLSDNFSRTKALGATDTDTKKPAVVPVVATPTVAAAAPAVATPAPAVAPTTPVVEAGPGAKVATIELTYNTPEQSEKGMLVVLGNRFTDAGAQAQVVSTKPGQDGQSVSELKITYYLDKPGLAEVSKLLDAAAVLRGSKLQEQPGDEQARKQAVLQAVVPPAQQVASPALVATPTAAVPTPAAAVAPAAPVPQQAPSKGEVIYVSAPPMPDGSIAKGMLTNQPESYSAFQIQVDPRDTNRAILLPAPGADVRLVGLNSPSLAAGYQVKAQEEGKNFLAVETPTQLARTADGWRITEKGTIGFAATATVYQAQQPAVVPQQAPQVAPQPTVAASFTRADVSEQELAKVGVSLADLEKSGQLQKLLEGKKTDLVLFTVANSEGVPMLFEAKLELQRDAQGKASLQIDLPKHELEMPQQLLGKEITPTMQLLLNTTGVVPLSDGFKNGKGEEFAAYLSVDKVMKRVVAVRPGDFKLPAEVHGVKLSPEQSKLLLEGAPMRLTGMTNDQQQKVDATVQLNPLSRKLTFTDSKPHVQVQVQQPTQARKRGVAA